MKKTLKKIICIALASSVISSSLALTPVLAAEGNTAPLAPIGLLTEEMENPLNVEGAPDFSWIVQDADKDEIQTAYEIVVTDAITGETVWDSQKIESSEQSYVKYTGPQLNPGYPYTWKVRTWDRAGAESPYSEEHSFSTGLETADWGAKWIHSGTKSSNHYWYARYEAALDQGKTVKKVLAYFAGTHDYELNINGQYIGRGQSFDYASETHYQGWDITSAVENSATLTAGLLNRWYGAGQGRAAEEEGLLGHIAVYYTDGTMQTIVTNEDWKVLDSTPLSGSTKRNGEGDFVEEYDARKAQEDFSRAGFDISSWNAAAITGAHPTASKTQVRAELSHPTDTLVYPVSVVTLSDGTTVADFGEVIPARPSIMFEHGKAGSRYTIQAGYALTSAGAIDTSNAKTQSTKMTYIYTQKDGEQVYNAWDHLGFRYLSIPPCGETFTKETIAAKIVHTDVPVGRESTFVSSDEMLNNVYEMMKRSALYSVQNQFVDTPTREKGQFLQDSINISDVTTTAWYERAASKKAIVQFLASADRYWTGNEAGRYNSVYPNGDGKRDIPDFTINVPYWVWNYYMQTGDRELLETAYPYMKATADYISKYIASSGLVTKLGGGDGSPNSYQYGIVDWPASGRFGYDWSGTKEGARTTVNMLSVRTFDTVAKMADTLGNTADLQELENRSAQLKEAINEKLLTEEGYYCDGLKPDGSQSTVMSQHPNSYALAFNIVPEDKKEKVAAYTASKGMRQGPMTADILVKGLFSAGKDDAALNLFTNTKDRGWAETIKKGGTFTWESWYAGVSEDSMSHGWGAAAAADIQSDILGVKVTQPGAKKIEISPSYGTVESAEGTVYTERGPVSVSYEGNTLNLDGFHMSITVPVNVTAAVILQNTDYSTGWFIEKGDSQHKPVGEKTEKGQIVEIGSGVSTFEFYVDPDAEAIPLPTATPEPTPASNGFSSVEAESGNILESDGMYVWANADALNAQCSMKNGVITISFDMLMISESKKYSEYTITDKNGTPIIYYQCEEYGGSNGYYHLNIGDYSASDKDTVVKGTKRGNSVSDYTHFENVIDLKNKTATVTVSNTADSAIGKQTGNITAEDVGGLRIYSNHTSRFITVKDLLAKQTGAALPTPTPTVAPTPTASVLPSSTPTMVPTPKPTTEPEQEYGEKYMHISFDDVYVCLKDITVKNYISVFENSFLKDLKNLHETYGAVFTLNCFNKYSSDSSYDIRNLPSRYAEELKENADWLKFAFHAEDDKTKYTADAVDAITASYNKFTEAVLKATGTAESIDTVTRLGFFTGNAANVKAIQNCDYGITGLLTGDDTRVSYYFDDTLNDYIIANSDYYDTDKNLRLIRSQKRLEGVSNTSSELDTFNAYTPNMLEIFTHEGEYKGNVPGRLKAYIEWAVSKGYKFGYAMDIPGEQIQIKSKTENANGNSMDYALQVNAGSNGAVIAAVYKKDGTLYSASVHQLSGNTMNLSVPFPADTEQAEIQLMLWNSINSMQPLSLVLKDDYKKEQEKPSESSAIVLDRETYPLVVGNKSKTDFSDWEERGSYFTLSAAVDSEQYDVSDITWSVENEDIAYIREKYENGVSVRGKRTGFTKVKATLPDGDTAVCAVSVIDNITRSTVQTLELNTSSLSLPVGAGADLIPIINPKDVFENGAMDTSLAWSSSDISVAKVENGKVTATGAGTAKIKAVSNDIGRSAECVVTVVNPNSNTGVTGQITADTAKVIDMTVGQTQKLTARSDSEIIWRSDNSFVADVDSNGVVSAYANSNIAALTDNPSYSTSGDTALTAPEKRIVFKDGKAQYEPGTVNIYATAKDGGAVATYKVRVADAENQAQSVAVSKERIYLGKGSTQTITAAILPADCMNQQVTWSSSDESIVKVTDTGRTVYELCSAQVMGIGAGTAVVTAECAGIKGSCSVTVTPEAVKVSDIRITNGRDIDLDEVLKLETQVTENAQNSELYWLTSDGDVVSVNDEGIVQGLKNGTATIYAVAADSVTDRAAVEDLQDIRAMGTSHAGLKAFLSTVVYSTCNITVRDSSPYLRNLHIPGETVMEDSVNLLWNRDSMLDAAELDHYEIYCNGTKTAEVTSLGYTQNGLSPETDYTFTVKAVDKDGKILAEQGISTATKGSSPVLNVLDYGAKGNGKVMDTHAIQKAINACPEGGTVHLPKGYIFYSGALFLKSNMIFKVDGILIGSTDGKDYPFVVTRWEGWRKVNQTGSVWANTTAELPDNHYAHASLINAGTYDEGENGRTGPYHVKNIVICGDGQINANGFKLGYNEGQNHKTGNGGLPSPSSPAIDQTIRGRAITFHNAQNVYLKDIQVAYSPSWTTHLIYCDNVTVDGIDVVSKGNGVTGAADDICILNGDGIDPDSSTNINIFNTYFYTGDDAVAVKSGRNKEGNDLDKPTQFLRITDCESNGSKGGFAVGSENASGLKNALFQNLKIRNITLSDGIWFKTYWSRGGVSENIILRDIDSAKPVEFAMNYATSTNNPADGVPVYRYITIENINTSARFYGLKKESSHEETYIHHVTIRGCASGSIDYGKDFSIWDAEPSKWSLSNASEILFYRTGQFEDVDITFASVPGMVREIDNQNRTITVIDIATPSSIFGEITSVLGGAQTYQIVDAQGGSVSDSAVKGGYTLRVTSQDGQHTSEFKIQTTASDIAYSDATIRRKEGAVNVSAIGEKELCVLETATVREILDDIAPVYGFEQSYVIKTADGMELGQEELAGEEAVLEVTSYNGQTKKEYKIVFVKVWDFTKIVEQKTIMNTVENYEVVYKDVTLHSDSGNDYMDTAAGMHFHGKSPAGNRYIAYTPEHDGVIRVTARRAFSNGCLYYAANPSFSGGKAIANLSNNSDWATGEFYVSAGQVFYLYCVSSGMEIRSMTFTPGEL